MDKATGIIQKVSRYIRPNGLWHCVPVPFLGVLIFFCSLNGVSAQQVRGLKVTSPRSDSTVVTDTLVYFRGIADPSGTLFLNGEEVPVYRTGVFAAAVSLREGPNELQIQLVVGGDTLRKRMVVIYQTPKPPAPTGGFAIESVRIMPEGELWLQPGDLLQVEMRATPGMDATFYNNIPLFEADPAEVGVAGIYRGEYIIQPSDVLTDFRVPFYLRDKSSGGSATVSANQRLTILDQPYVLTGVTATGAAPLYYGLGSDRLGGAKMGELDSLVKLEISGKMGNMYRVRLSEQVQAYIPVGHVRISEGAHFRPYSLTGSWMVSSDSTFDYVNIALEERLPYTHLVRQDPTRIVVDIYGAVSNSNWITQKGGLRAIRNVWYEQVSKDVFRVFIELKDEQLWGYRVGYEDNRLVVRVKPRPDIRGLHGLTVAVDAGHGGSNPGAAGMAAGAREKALTLAMALKLRDALERAGATVLMTRTGDQSVSNSFRLNRFRQSDADLLVSIHCNASVNPMVKGVSTYYRHQAYRPLSQHIQMEMRKLGLADFGNVGGFNFILNAPTELPSALVEVGFLSNPADEERLLDGAFREEVAERIVEGIRRFIVDSN